MQKENINSNTKTAKKNKRRKGTAKKVSKVFWLVVLGIVLVGIGTGAVVASHVVKSVLNVKNGDAIIDLTNYKANQSQTSFIYAMNKDGEWEEVCSLHGDENRIWVGLDDISPAIKDAFVYLEDKRFYEHHGVDWKRTASVMLNYNFSQGGSTITQQLIKNITGNNEVTIVRKFKEIATALNLEANYNKDDILENYLNTVYLGNGCYGVQTASETYFGKNASDLSLAEAAALVCITKAPYKYNPLINPENNRERQLYCLKTLRDEGAIDEAEYQQAVNYKLIFTNSEDYVPSDEIIEKRAARDKEDSVIYSYYTEYVIDSVINDLMDEYGYTKSQAYEQLYYGGLQIYSAVDINVQEDLEYIFEHRIAFDDDELQGAMTIMDYAGRVVAICGGVGEKTSNRGSNRACNSYLQPGSTIKPISTYAPLLDKGEIYWSYRVLDKAFYYNGEYWPHNVDKTFGSGGRVTIQRAVQESMNTVPARLINEVLTPKESIDYLKNKFHLSRIDEKKDSGLAPLATGSLTIGTNTTEMAAAYATFGNGGKYYKPYSFYYITNASHDKFIVYHANPEGTPVPKECEKLVTEFKNEKCEQAISEAAAGVMNKILQTVNTSYYDDGCSYITKFETMCKTGTTTSDKDRWFCCGTPYYVSSVWYGYDKPKTIGATGGNPAGILAFKVLDRVHKDLDPDGKDFYISDKCVEKSYCTYSGKLASSGCGRSTGWFDADNLPAYCSSCGGYSGSYYSSQGDDSDSSDSSDTSDSTESSNNEATQSADTNNTADAENSED